MDNNDLKNNINSFFENMSYNEHYANDIWFTIIAFIIVIIIAIYFYIISNLRSYKTEWQKNKCNPLLMPFASLIDHENSKDNELLYTLNNFRECLNTLNSELAYESKKPIDSIQSGIKNFFELLYKLFIDVQKFIVYLFMLLLEFFNSIMGKMKNLLLYIRLFFINTNSFLSQILSVFTVIYYTLILVIKSWKIIFTLFVLGWLLTIVIPSSSFVITSLTIMIGLIVMINPFTFLFLIIPLIVSIVSFLIALIFFILVLAIYIIFIGFVEQLF